MSSCFADDEYERESCLTRDSFFMEKSTNSGDLEFVESFDVKELNEVCKSFCLDEKKLLKLRKLFKRLDKDESNTIDRKELFEWLETPANLFTEKLFELIEIEKSGHLDFVEFVRTICTFGLFGQQEILSFCFFVFDGNKNGELEDEEFMSLVQLLHEDESSRIMSVDFLMREFDTDKNGKISFSEFLELNKHFPYVLYPAFRLQRLIEEKTFGKRFWQRQRTKKKSNRKKQLNFDPREALKTIKKRHSGIFQSTWFAKT